MNTDTSIKSVFSQLPDTARESSRHATEATKEMAKDAATAARDVYDNLSNKVGDGVDRTKAFAQTAMDATKDAASRAGDATRDICHSVSTKAEDALVSSKEYARENPFPVALGALVAGFAIGCMVGMGQREQPSFRRLFY